MMLPDKFLSLLGDKTLIPLGIAIMAGYVLVWAVKESDKIELQAQAQTVMERKLTGLSRLEKHLVRIEERLHIPPLPDYAPDYGPGE